MSNYLVVTTPFAAYRIGQRITDAGVMAAILASTDVVFVVPVKLPIPSISCAYPLDATVEQLQGIGLHGRLGLSNNDQTTTYTIVGGLGSSQEDGAVSGEGQTLDFTTGKTAIEFAATVPSDLVTDPDMMAIVGEIISPDQTHSISAAIGNRTISDVQTYVLQIAINGSLVYANYALMAPVAVVAFLLDADAGTVIVYADGTPLTLSSNVLAAVHYLVFIQCIEAAGMNAGDAGKQYSMTLRSSAADMTTTFPSGTKDGCGNVIP